jgi:hypothetical protein
MLGSVLGADQEVVDFDYGVMVSLFEKRAYTGHDFADENVAVSRSLMIWGDRNLENGDHSGVSVSVNINGE